MLKKWIVLFLTVAFALSACNSPTYNQSEDNVADVKIATDKAFKQSDKSAATKPSLRVEKGSYIDKTPISLYKNPSWMKNKVVIRGDGLPFSYYARTLAKGAGSYVLTKYQTELDKTVRLSISYSGTVRGALDLLAAKSGYEYTISGNTVYWKAFVTKTYDIAFMPGGTAYVMGKKSGGSGGSGGGDSTDFTTSDDTADQFSNLTGELSLWKDLETTIGQLLSAEGKITVSEATTTVTVRDRPTNIKLVGQYIHNLNTKLSKQVLVKVQVLEIDLINDYNMGIDWTIIAKAFKNSSFVLNANYGTPINITRTLAAQSAVAVPIAPVEDGVSTTAGGTVPVIGTAGSGLPSYTILFNALSQQGKTSVVSEPRVVCLNNQVSVIRITESEGYLASRENTTLSGTGGAVNNTVTSQLTPGTVVTGLTLYVLPKILGDKVYMQVNADLSTNRGTESFGSGDNEIQLPRVVAKNFNQRSAIKSGDTLILSGFRQVANNASAMQFMKSQALGGKGSRQETTETIVLITPIILDGNA